MLLFIAIIITLWAFGSTVRSKKVKRVIKQNWRLADQDTEAHDKIIMLLRQLETEPHKINEIREQIQEQQDIRRQITKLQVKNNRKIAFF